jgi:hypothetical protein
MRPAMGAISGNELDRQGTAVLKRYEIRIVGELDAEAVDAFAGLDLAWDGQVTTLSSELDQAGLHGLLERIRSLGLELMDVRQIRQRR